MKSFPADSKDAIEQLYGQKILHNFPNYAVLWERFIGVRANVGRLLPYALKIPHSVSKNKRMTIIRIQEEIAMAHYTLFCHLAGAHFQVERLHKITNPTSSKSSWFRHWESFEVAYLHLGISLNQIYHLWNLLFLLRGQLQRSKDGSIHKTKKGFSPEYLRIQEFRDARKLRVWNSFKLLHQEVAGRRNNITHYSRSASKPLSGKIYVPLKVRPNIPWSAEAKNEQYWETTARAAIDLEKTERAINSAQTLFIERLDSYITRAGIRILR